MFMNIHLSDLLFAVSAALDRVEISLLGATLNHSKRVALISTRICQAVGLPDSESFDIASCSVLHDNALTQYIASGGNERLEGLDWHCVQGEKNAVHFPFQGNVKNVILYHHENWDGSGFFGLKADDIPFLPAVLRLADNLDVMLALGKETADTLNRTNKIRSFVERLSGITFSPKVSEAFLDIFDEHMLESLFNENIDKSLHETVPLVKDELSIDKLAETSYVFGGIIDAKSPFTYSHSSGIAQKMSDILNFYNIGDEEKRKKLFISSYLHDIGKLGVPNNLLDKPGKLTNDEFLIVKGHAQFSYDILSSVRGLEEISLWASSHHEKLDGTGYPFGLSADMLPFESRLLACIDIYQALTEQRPYRAGLLHEKAIDIMKQMSDAQKIDAEIVSLVNDAFRV